MVENWKFLGDIYPNEPELKVLNKDDHATFFNSDKSMKEATFI